mmetsp:Transcript_3010/g.8689  ORF Transcript_3010/g.8689 Transcript_3010/m.8689 type:complete len:95 (+) Transcript_3010:1313-1597(+)
MAPELGVGSVNVAAIEATCLDATSCLELRRNAAAMAGRGARATKADAVQARESTRHLSHASMAAKWAGVDGSQQRFDVRARVVKLDRVFVKLMS